MADVVQLPGVWQQILTVVGLRWRMLRRSLQKKNNIFDLLGLIISGFGGAILVFGLCAAFFAGTYAFFNGHHEQWIALLFWGIFFWWQGFPIFAAGFGVHFEFRSLLRFPLNLSTFYILGLVYGLADFGAVASLCWLASMTLAVAAAKPSVLPVMILTCVLFAGMNLALERLLGSWLEKILAKRRARELFFALFILLMISVQFIAPAIQRYGKPATPRIREILPYLTVFPGSLAGRAVAGAALQQNAAVLIGTSGLLIYALVCGGLLWLRFAAEYRGEELSETSAAARSVPHTGTRIAYEKETAEILPPQIAAMLIKESRYVFRNSFALVSLIFPPMIVLLFVTQFAGAHPTVLHKGMSAELFFPGMLAYLVLILMAPAYNCFAYEGRGMLGYFMAPVRFSDVLMGKNLMQCILLAAEVGVCVAVLVWRIGLPGTPVFVSTLAAVAFAVAGQLTIANWSSLTFPKRMEFGKMRGNRQGGMAVLIAFGAQAVFGGVCAVILLSGRWLGNPWLSAEAFAFLTAAAVGGYRASLEGMSRLAERNKETLLEALAK
ncbi:MAG TPA: hypothetical protein VLV88_03955 [Terriglobales bacterium]|nr:hypothetical protein [Terriglobales bacterium]